MTSNTEINYYELNPEDSKFYTIGIDVTHKCNMNCANCYSPLRTIPDIDKNGIINFMKSLGQKTEIRFTGGEPTLRDDLCELISEGVAAGHRVSIMTNGLKLADKDYCKKLKDAGLKFVCISMNGADDDTIYRKMDQMNCAEAKMTALRNIAEFGFFVNINCIVAKGINDHIPERLCSILRDLKLNGVLRLRNIGEIGRHMSQDNYSFDELIDLVGSFLNKSSETIKKHRLVNGFDEQHNVLFPIDEGKKFNTIWIKITDWRPYSNFIPDPLSIRRGRMTNDFKVAPFFEHVKVNGN